MRTQVRYIRVVRVQIVDTPVQDEDMTLHSKMINRSVWAFIVVITPVVHGLIWSCRFENQSEECDVITVSRTGAIPSRVARPPLG